jgi:hypothetical protein
MARAVLLGEKTETTNAAGPWQLQLPLKPLRDFRLLWPHVLMVEGAEAAVPVIYKLSP